MDETKKTDIPQAADQTQVSQPADQAEGKQAADKAEVKNPAAKQPEPEYFTLKAKPPKKKPKEDVEIAKKIANRYLGIQALEKIVNAKKARKKKKELELRFKTPETPEEFYDRAQKYVTGAECSVPFQERALYYQKAADMFAGAEDYNDAPELAKSYAELAEKVRTEGYENAYAEAVRKKESASSSDDWFEAARAFERISGYRDADQLAQECEQTLARRASLKKPLRALLVLVIFGLLFAGVSFSRTDVFHYHLAQAAHRAGLESVATTFFANSHGYRNSDKMLDEIRYSEGQNAYAEGDYKKALSYYEKCSETYPGLQQRLDECNYALGKKLLEEGHNKQAKECFKACSEGYQDRELCIDECNYNQGLDALEKLDYEEAVSHFVNSHNFADSADLRVEPELVLLRTAMPGDKVYFGAKQYIVLDRQGQNLTLLSSKLTEEQPYNDVLAPVSWKNCSLRATLNSQAYLDELFSADEQALIQKTRVDKGTDRLYLLSKEEYLRYQEIMGSKDALWWLRDNGDDPDSAKFVSDKGMVMESGYPVNSTDIYGRAALQITIPEA